MVGDMSPQVYCYYSYVHEFSVVVERTNSRYYLVSKLNMHYPFLTTWTVLRVETPFAWRVTEFCIASSQLPLLWFANFSSVLQKNVNVLFIVKSGILWLNYVYGYSWTFDVISGLLKVSSRTTVILFSMSWRK